MIPHFEGINKRLQKLLVMLHLKFQNYLHEVKKFDFFLGFVRSSYIFSFLPMGRMRPFISALQRLEALFNFLYD